MISDERLEQIFNEGLALVARETDEHYRQTQSAYIESELISSPIEQYMVVALNTLFKISHSYFKDISYSIHPQHLVGKYRVDFLVRIVALSGIHCATMETLISMDKVCIVECDGHEFHEKTKEQAQRDKERDRFLQSKGYAVLHFTGSEIYRNPFKCAHEVYKYLTDGSKLPFSTSLEEIDG